MKKWGNNAQKSTTKYEMKDMYVQACGSCIRGAFRTSMIARFTVSVIGSIVSSLLIFYIPIQGTIHSTKKLADMDGVQIFFYLAVVWGIPVFCLLVSVAGFFMGFE